MRVSAIAVPFDEAWELAQDAFGQKIKTYARNSFYAIDGYSQEDVENELLEVLWKCVLTYDPNNGATFNTFAQRSFQNRIGSLIRFAGALKRKAEWVSLSDEAVSLAIEEANSVKSAEDQACLRMLVVERLERRKSSGNARRKRRDGDEP